VNRGAILTGPAMRYALLIPGSQHLTTLEIDWGKSLFNWTIWITLEKYIGRSEERCASFGNRTSGRLPRTSPRRWFWKTMPASMRHWRRCENDGPSVEDLDSIERGLKPLLKALRRDDAILQKLRDIENRGASAAAVQVAAEVVSTVA
jgi:hypothetical protein